MRGEVLWLLDEETDWKTFERIAADLLYRNGYPRIVPVEGPRDGGRDAQSIARPGRGLRGEVTFFQFSIEKDWKAKLRRELRKVHNGRHDPQSFVFVTTQRARGEELDVVVSEAETAYGYDLTIFGREWVRLQLEVANPDLAALHLGISPEVGIDAGAPDFVRPGGSDAEKAWAAFQDGDFARAVGELRRYLEFNPGSYDARKALAWAQYKEHHYLDALASINLALEQPSGDPDGTMVRACILAEYGMSHGNKASVSEANAAFEEAVSLGEHWVVRYNFGNTLGALGRHEEAVLQFEIAVSQNPDRPEVWKNLGDAYHQVGRHEDEMAAFDRALELNPELPNALISKGTSLLMDLNRPADAVRYIQKGMNVAGGEGAQWPHSWYWLAMAQDESGATSDALHTIAEGLKYQPGSHYLSHLRVRILTNRWRTSKELKATALEHLPGWLEQKPNEYFVARALSEIHEADGDENAAWRPLVSALNFFEFQGATISAAGFDLTQVRIALDHLPDYAVYRLAFPAESMMPLDENPSTEWLDFLLRLDAYLAVPFGLVLEAAKDEGSSLSPMKMLEDLQGELEIAITRASVALAGLIDPGADQDAVIEALCEAIGAPSVFSTFEFMSMATWLGNLLGGEEFGFGEALDQFPIGNLQGAVASEAFLLLNQFAKLFDNDADVDPI